MSQGYRCRRTSISIPELCLRTVDDCDSSRFFRKVCLTLFRPLPELRKLRRLPDRHFEPQSRDTLPVCAAQTKTERLNEMRQPTKSIAFLCHPQSGTNVLVGEAFANHLPRRLRAAPLESNAGHSCEQRYCDGGARCKDRLVPTHEFAEPIETVGRTSENRPTREVPLDVRGHLVRRLVSAATIFFKGLHRDPVEVAARRLY
jgi:hypothetical protein